jgi:predicted AlkP superfamily pyrophosphatase or phosphodiesterase
VRERGKYVFASTTQDIRRGLESPEKAAEMTDLLRFEAAIAGLDGRPDFMAIHFTELDAAQHDFGAGSPEALAALARTDDYLGQFLDALGTRGLRDGAAIVIASDHGFSPLHTAIFPGRLFHAYGLLELDDHGNLESWDAYPWPGGGVLAVYVNPESDGSEPVREKVDRVIDILASDPENFVHAVYRSNEMTRWGGYPDAYALINLKDGYAFGGDLDSVLIRSGTQTKGIHGFVPDRSGTYGALILSGAGIQAGVRLELVRMEDIAPTIANLLGLSLPSAEGRILTRALTTDLQ